MKKLLIVFLLLFAVQVYAFPPTPRLDLVAMLVEHRSREQIQPHKWLQGLILLKKMTEFIRKVLRQQAAVVLRWGFKL